jgi:hypothetical protein
LLLLRYKRLLRHRLVQLLLLLWLHCLHLEVGLLELCVPTKLWLDRLLLLLVESILLLLLL